MAVEQLPVDENNWTFQQVANHLHLDPNNPTEKGKELLKQWLSLHPTYRKQVESGEAPKTKAYLDGVPAGQESNEPAQPQQAQESVTPNAMQGDPRYQGKTTNAMQGDPRYQAPSNNVSVDEPEAETPTSSVKSWKPV